MPKRLRGRANCRSAAKRSERGVSEPEQDQRIRLAAVEHVKQLGLSGSFSSEQLYAGFTVDGTRIPLTNPQRGIFKPAQSRRHCQLRGAI